MQQRHWAEAMLPPSWRECIPQWLQEDCPSFDWSAAIFSANLDIKNEYTAQLRMKQQGVIAGMPFVTQVFEYLQCHVKWLCEEGEYVSHVPCLLAVVYGKPQKILQGERLALNILSRACGIASQASQCVSIVKTAECNAVIAGTRKTTPGFRLVEKYALMVGGAQSHRMDLGQLVMLKDNHIDIAGSINAALKALQNGERTTEDTGKEDVCENSFFHLKIEVECKDGDETKEALASGASIVMLDNVPHDRIAGELSKILYIYPAACIEISGGINLQNLKLYAETLSTFAPLKNTSNDNKDEGRSGCNGPKFILSLGCLTNGYPVIDCSLGHFQPK